VSRGGTRKARAAHEAERRKRAKQQQKEQATRAKATRAEGPKVGKGRAFALHLAGLPAPFVASFGLILSSRVSATGEPVEGDYWLAPLVNDPNASYFSEPGGFLLLGAVLSVTVALFFLTPVMVWRYVYRDWEPVRRDRSSVDNSFTLIALAVVLWIYRAIAGYTPAAFHGVVQIAVLLSVYIPFFSGVLGLIIPSVPGSGRVGGILPDFMKFPFTEKMLFTPPEQEEVRAAAATAKQLRQQQFDEAREERARLKEQRKQRRKK
jgi:hypothetical protein